MNKFTLTLTLLLMIIMAACSSGIKEAGNAPEIELHFFDINNLSDERYPDNPDIGFRASDYRVDFFKNGAIGFTENPFVVNFTFFTKTSDSISLNAVNISELIPTIPDHVKADQYLTYISCINQEWNRNQVKFTNSSFQSSLPDIVRVDVARNCLNACLWEVILYIKENEQVLPYAHGWFDFPNAQYAKLFEIRNQLPFSQFKQGLEDWVDPPSQQVNLTLLRSVLDTLDIQYKDLSDSMYPLKGEQQRKYKEIISPEKFSSMKALQSDSTLFATFSPPGFYNRNHPRKTELGRFYHLKNIELHQIASKLNGKALHEIKLEFVHKNTKQGTTLIIGGIDLSAIPVLEIEEANNGWKSSMGIGNHTFYESYEEHLSASAKLSPYYALLMDESGKWLDSHHVGIDGPLFHFSDEARKHLHLWVLSFERHALVGHYEVIIE